MCLIESNGDVDLIMSEDLIIFGAQCLVLELKVNPANTSNTSCQGFVASNHCDFSKCGSCLEEFSFLIGHYIDCVSQNGTATIMKG